MTACVTSPSPHNALGSMHLECFIWHPYCAVYHERDQEFRLNDITPVETLREEMRMVYPPRSTADIPLHFDIHEIVRRWAHSNQWCIRVVNHMVICHHSGDLMLVDYILERDMEISLVCIDCHSGQIPDESRMMGYMRLIKSICVESIGIIPISYVLCISGVDEPVVTCQVV
jgi:hypothetical protein